MVRDCENFRSCIDLDLPRYIAAIYGRDHEEVRFVAEFLRDRDLIKASHYSGTKMLNIHVTHDGFIRAEELQKKHVASDQAFVAMWFNEKMNEAYAKGFHPGISKAGYKPMRIDRTEYTNEIDDEIIAQIRRSRFVVADFTGHRSGVYFEAGFALGLNLPVIWTCWKDDIKDLHFDVRQYNCIDWKTPEELAGRLQVRIEALIGDGPFKVR